MNRVWVKAEGALGFFFGDAFGLGGSSVITSCEDSGGGRITTWPRLALVALRYIGGRFGESEKGPVVDLRAPEFGLRRVGQPRASNP
jgi:hypothetical protein